MARQAGINRDLLAMAFSEICVNGRVARFLWVPEDRLTKGVSGANAENKLGPSTIRVRVK